MARGTRRRRPQRRPTKPKHNWANKLTRESRQRDKFLDKGKENYFRYDLEDMLARAGVPDEHAAPFISTLFAKGTRQGVSDAKEYAQEKHTEGLFDADTHKKIVSMLENFSTWR